MTRARICVANGTYAITRRTAFRKLFWTPSDPMVVDCYRYALALGAQKYGVRLHHGVLMPTHSHLTITPTENNMPAFFRFVHRESARCLQEWLLHQGYDAPPCVWDKRQTHAMRLVTVESQVRWAVYSQLNPVAAGLVERVEDYPGWAADFGLMKGGIEVVKKPPVYHGKDRPSEIELKLDASAVMRHGFAGDVDAMVYRLRKLARSGEQAYRDERRRSGRVVIGAAAVKAAHPWSEPVTPRERRGELNPRFMVAGEDGDPVRAELCKRLSVEGREFDVEYAATLDAWRKGDREVVFPAGSYQMVVLHGAAVMEPREGAILCAPDRLGMEPVDLRDVIARTEAAFREQAAEDVEEACQDLSDVTSEDDGVRGAPDGEGEGEGADREEGEPTATRRRSRRARGTRLVSPAKTASDAGPRIVVHRNRRDRGPP